jgi:hypothetical protein
MILSQQLKANQAFQPTSLPPLLGYRDAAELGRLPASIYHNQEGYPMQGQRGQMWSWPPYGRAVITLVVLSHLVVGVPGGRAQGTAVNILPPPASSVAIGRVTYHWLDSSRAETFSEPPGARREIIVDVWYPAKPVAARPAASYLPELPILRRVLGEAAMRREFAPVYAPMEAGRLRTHAVEGAPVRCMGRGCPVLIFSPGGGVDRSFYTAQYEDLASHGYVVAVIAHPYNTHLVVFPDERIIRSAPVPPDTTSPDLSIPVWRRQLRSELWSIAHVRRLIAIAASDISFVINQLTRYARDPALGAPFVRQLDLKRIGVLGHSGGGEAAALACQIDRRIKACLNQDGVIQNLPFSRDANGRTMEQPFMYIGRQYDPPRNPPDSLLASMQMTRAEYDSLTRAIAAGPDDLLADMPGGAFRVNLKTPGANHMSFSDEPLIEAAGDSAKTANALLALRIIKGYSRAFFDKTLRGRTATLLDRPTGADSALVSVERFRPSSKRRPTGK